MADTPIEPSDLPALLEKDNTGKVRDAAVKEMMELAADIKKTLDAGVSPAEFEKLSKVHTGLLAGAGVVLATWQDVHAASS